MLSLLGQNTRLCDGLTRREMLRIGGLGFTGLAWGDLLKARAATAASSRQGSFGRAKSCIIIFNYGGPSHIDTLDMKPDAPVEIRGEFRPTATGVPGILLAGGGIQPGRVHGSSDRGAAYPAEHQVSPGDIAATIYHCLGIDPRAHVNDQQGRPLVISAGNVVHALLS